MCFPRRLWSKIRMTAEDFPKDRLWCVAGSVGFFQVLLPPKKFCMIELLIPDFRKPPWSFGEISDPSIPGQLLFGVADLRLHTPQKNVRVGVQSNAIME